MQNTGHIAFFYLSIADGLPREDAHYNEVELALQGREETTLECNTFDIFVYLKRITRVNSCLSTDFLFLDLYHF